MPGRVTDWMNNVFFEQSSSAATARGALGILTTGSTTGSIFYCDSATGASGNAGTQTAPVATVKQALALCTADKGDVVLCFPAHAETIVNATDLAVSKAGVTIASIGQGSDRATITFGTSTSANIPVSAAGVTLQGLVLLNNIDSATAAVTVSAADCALVDVEIRDQTDKEFVTPILTTSAGDRLTLLRVFHNGYVGGDACTESVSLIGCDTALVQDCRFMGTMSTACVNMLTTASTKVVVKGCVFQNGTNKTLTKLVKDTQGSSTWCLTESFDLASCRKVYGSSGSVVMPDGGEWRYATATSASPLTAATLWTYTGTIEFMVVARVTTTIQAQATTVKYQVTSDSLTAADLCGTKDMNAFAVGSLLHIDGTPGNAALATTGVANAVSQVTPCLATCVTSGTIAPVFGAASTGALAHELRWRPVSRGATVV